MYFYSWKCEHYFNVDINLLHTHKTLKNNNNLNLVLIKINYKTTVSKNVLIRNITSIWQLIA